MPTLKYGAITLDWSSILQNGLDLESPESVLTLLKSYLFANGAGDDQANLQWSDEAQLSAASAVTLDLTALAAGPFGTAVFGDVRAIAIVNTSNSGDLEVGAAASNIWEPFVKATGDVVLIKKSGMSLWVAPKDGSGVVDATHKNLKINNPGGSAQTYRIAILGTA